MGYYKLSINFLQEHPPLSKHHLSIYASVSLISTSDPLPRLIHMYFSTKMVLTYIFVTYTAGSKYSYDSMMGAVVSDAGT